MCRCSDIILQRVSASIAEPHMRCADTHTAQGGPWGGAGDTWKSTLHRSLVPFSEMRRSLHSKLCVTSLGIDLEKVSSLAASVLERPSVPAWGPPAPAAAAASKLVVLVVTRSRLLKISRSFAISAVAPTMPPAYAFEALPFGPVDIALALFMASKIANAMSSAGDASVPLAEVGEFADGEDEDEDDEDDDDDDDDDDDGDDRS